MAKLLAILLLIPGILLTIFCWGLILSLPVMWLWNWLMPTLFHLPTVTWLQAWGLNVLCGFLFKTSTSSSSKKD